MGFDLAAAGIADLFGLGGLGDIGATIGADLGFGAAADAGLGAAAADTGLAAGLGSEVAASAAPAIAAGDIAGQVAAEGGLAADLGGAAGAAGAGAADLGAAGAASAGDVLAGAAPTADVGAAGAGLSAADLAAAGDLGTSVEGGTGLGGAASDALSFAPTPAAAPGLGVGGGAPTAVASSPAGISGGLSSAADYAATGDTNIAANLGATAAAPPTEASTAATAFGAGSAPVPNATAPFSAGADTTAAGAAAAAAPAAAATPAAASPSLTSEVGSVLSSPWTKAAELALPLGLIGYNAMKGTPPLPSAAQAATNNAVAGGNTNVPLYNKTAATDLALANNNQISPAQAAQIDIFKKDSYNQLYQQIANEGNADPTATSQWVQGKAQIDEQALAQQQAMIDNLVKTAFSAAGAANAATSATDATLMQAAQIQVQQDTAFQQSISSALQSFGMIAAFSNLGQKVA